MTGLFDDHEASHLDEAKPLAARMRPRTLDEFVGQEEARANLAARSEELAPEADLAEAAAVPSDAGTAAAPAAPKKSAAPTSMRAASASHRRQVQALHL